MIDRVFSRTGYVYELGEPVANTEITVTEILLMASASSTRICRITLDNGRHIEVNDPLEIWYTPQ